VKDSALKDQIETCCADRIHFLSELRRNYAQDELMKLVKKFFNFNWNAPIEEFTILIYKLNVETRYAMVHVLLIPLEDVPLYINDKEPDVEIMAHWRLEIGK